MVKRKIRRLWRYGLLSLAFSLAGCGGGGGSDSGGGGGGGTTAREWTYMVYMGADNNLSSAGDLRIAFQQSAKCNVTHNGNEGKYKQP